MTVFSFFLRNGGVIEWPAPDGMTMQQLVHGMVNLRGHLSADLFVPMDNIACIGVKNGTQEVVRPVGQTVQ